MSIQPTWSFEHILDVVQFISIVIGIFGGLFGIIWTVGRGLARVSSVFTELSNNLSRIDITLKTAVAELKELKTETVHLNERLIKLEMIVLNAKKE